MTTFRPIDMRHGGILPDAPPPTYGDIDEPPPPDDGDGPPPRGPIKPTAFQQKVLLIPERYNVSLLGGRGGGKSVAQELLILRHVVEHGALARVLVIRRTFPALREVEERLLRMFGDAYGAANVSYNRAEHVFRLPTGALVELGQLDAASDYGRYQGRECTLLSLSEITLHSNLRHVWMLRSNLRGPASVPLRVVVDGNPGGPSHGEVKRLFIDGRQPWVPYELEPGSGDEWVTAPSTLADNPHLDGDKYRRTLLASTGGDRALAASWIEGSWDALGGLFFGDLLGPHLVIPDPAGWRVPGRDKGWRSYIAVDWGVSAPAVALLFAVPERRGLVGPGGLVLPERSRIVLDEVSSHDPADPTRGQEWPPSVLAEEILTACERWGVRAWGVVDDARGLQGETLIEEMRRHKLHLKRPDKSRLAGAAIVKGMMSAAKNRDPDQPWLLINERCRYTLETLAALPRDPRRVEDCLTTANDHAYDALRYGCTHRGTPTFRVNRGDGR